MQLLSRMLSGERRNSDSHREGHSIKAQWKRIVQEKIPQFDQNVDYEHYRHKFIIEFQRRWERIYKSPEKGLAGFTELGTIGFGAFGNIILVRCDFNGKLYAAKILTKSKIVKSKQVKHLLDEKRVLHSIRFPNHTHLEFSRKDFDNVYLITAALHADMFEYLRKAGHFTEKQTLFYAAQVFLALEYLHCLNLLYRDLKPENMCLDHNGYLKLIDYGFTKHVETRTMTLCGTPEYLAPEIIEARPYGTSIDWWSFGILIYEFIHGSSPFGRYSENPIEMYTKIVDGKYVIKARMSHALKKLLTRLIEPDLTKRIGVCNNGDSDIKNHIWFRTVDWYAILNQTVQPPFLPSKDDFPITKTSKRSTMKETSDTNQYEQLFEDF